AGDYQLCFNQRCHSMSEWLGPPQATQPALELWSCEQSSPAASAAGQDDG
ncbi:MAG: DUF1850 domain-containing protein, partial [Pseudomonas sp.]